jgi:all-trans-retinol 13,14-reductase
MHKGKEIVIVGSGLGGLLCGAILSGEGYKVTVLERNKQIGGNLQTFSRDRHIFDSGVHYVGSLDKGQNLYKVFKFLGILDKLKLQRLDEEAFDKIMFDNDPKTYRLAQGYDKFISNLAIDFPEERAALEEYARRIRLICSKFPMYNLREGDYMEQSEFLEISAKTFLESVTSNKKLQNILAGNNSLYAGVADKTPVYVHALVTNSYIESSWRVVDGGSAIARHLSKIIKDNEGTVLTRKSVCRFHCENDKLTYAETEEGEKFYADHFISNIHPVQTLRLTDSEMIRQAYRNRIGSLENSISFFIINVTLKPDCIPYEKSNYYWFSGDDVWSAADYEESSWPHYYSLFFSANSSTGQYADGITLMSYMRYDEVKEWEDTFNTTAQPANRGSDYDEFKKKKAEILFEAVEKRFPGFRDAVLNYYTSTPLTFRDYMGTEDGSVYGIMKDFKNPLKTMISPKTKIENLYLTGQNINLHGIVGVTISSLITCSIFTGMTELLKKINDSQDE